MGRVNDSSVLSFIRRGSDPDVALVFVCSFTPVARPNYRIGVPWDGWWPEVLNSDGIAYGGSGMGNMGGLNATPVESHGFAQSLNVSLPPLGVVMLRGARGATHPVAAAERQGWTPSLGAVPDAGGTTVRVWSPTASTVEVVVEDGSAQALLPEDGGTHAGHVAGLGPGGRYKVRVDGRGPYPDPASR